MARAAAAYVRISQDRGGESLGVQRQERLCRELAERKGWPVAEVYTDNDLSAYNGKPRPAYKRMLADLEAGERDAVVCVDLDRLTRHPAELEHFIVLADRLGIALANVSGDTDLSTSDGRFRARILGAVARQESEKKSDRIRRQREDNAKRGIPHPGPRAFGWKAGNLELEPREAKLIRQAAQDVLAGVSMRSIADRWNAQGVTTARGGRWNVNSIRDVLTRPRVAGLRVHRGEVVGEGIWTPILDRDTYERLAALAKGRERPTGRPPTRLLAGILRCGLCGGPMRSSTSKGMDIYACRRLPGQDASCGRLSINADNTDAYVRDEAITALASQSLAALMRQEDRQDTSELTARLAADEESLAQLARDHYADRVISRAEFLAAREAVEARIAETRAEIESAMHRNGLHGVPGDEAGLADWWDHKADTDTLRRVVTILFAAVTVHPLSREAPRRFTTDRITLTWNA